MRTNQPELVVHGASLVRELKSVLEQDGVRAALIFLNGTTDYRFTALYRFDQGTLHNLYFFDRENPSQESIADIPVSASYCAYVRHNDAPFTISNSADNLLLESHPKRSIVHSYCGVPLRDMAGTEFGTICHFSFPPLPVDSSNIELMEAMGPLLKVGR